MQKVLIVSDYLDDIGGAETYIKKLRTVLEKGDYQVEFFGGENLTRKDRIRGLFTSMWNFSMAKKFKKKVEEYEPDIIWFHNITRYLGPKILQKLEEFDTLNFITYHDLGYFHLFAKDVKLEEHLPDKFSLGAFLGKSTKGWLVLPYSIFKFWKLAKIRKLLRKHIDTHLVPASFMEKYVLNHGYGTNVKVLSHFIDFKDIGQRKDVHQDKMNLMFFGRMSQEKGMGVLMYSLVPLYEAQYVNKRFYQDTAHKIRMFIFGTGEKKDEFLDTYENWIFDYSNEENIDLRIIDPIKESHEGKFIYYFGHRDYATIKEFLSISHINLSPSLFLETFGLAALEAMAHGVPTLGFDKGNLSDLLIDKYKLPSEGNEADLYKDKIYHLIKNFNLDVWKKDSERVKQHVAEKVI